MTENPYAPDPDNLPEEIPVFPLYGVLLLPGGNLPLNIFEPRYLSMVRDSMSSHMMIGMVQTRGSESEDIYNIGCAGKITSYQETADGRYIINLNGISRFSVTEELSHDKPYRTARANWQPYHKVDMKKDICPNLNRRRLLELLEVYFDHHCLSCDWKHIENSSNERLVTCLSMICPIEANEKQALLETRNNCERGQKFMTILEMAVKGTSICCSDNRH